MNDQEKRGRYSGPSGRPSPPSPLSSANGGRWLANKRRAKRIEFGALIDPTDGTRVYVEIHDTYARRPEVVFVYERPDGEMFYATIPMTNKLT